MGNSKIGTYFRFIGYKIRKYFSGLSEEYYIFKNYIDKGTFLFGDNHISNSDIGKYSYVSFNSIIKNCEIGRYCSIGPNVVIGFGNHKIDTLSTHPSLYLNEKDFGSSVQERTEETFKKLLSRMMYGSGRMFTYEMELRLAMESLLAQGRWLPGIFLIMRL